MTRQLRRFGVLLLTLVILVSAAGCSEISFKHWRKTAGNEFLIDVIIPATNPAFPGGNNQEQWFVDAVTASVAEANQHPDLTVHAWLTEGDVCPRDDPSTDKNCVQAWLVPNAHLDDISPGAAGLAIRLADSTHYFNGNAGNPARIMIANDWTGQPAGSRENAVCHELGHVYGLEHFDSDDDGTPDQTGPCVNAHLDYDPEPYRGTLGFDWSNLDALYDTCHNDPDGPQYPFVVGYDPDGVNNLNNLGYDSCGSGAAATTSAGEPAPESYDGLTVEVSEDTFEDLKVG